jgi:DNA-binding PadR family transcriptional regulator
MPRPVGTIGGTKLKILAIIFYNDLKGITSYGYNIWTILKTRYYHYMEDGNLRNVYRHLKELERFGLIEKGVSQSVKGAPVRQLYSLTEKGKGLKEKFGHYLSVLEIK